MEIIDRKITGLVEIIPKVYGDERGYFFESFREDVLKEITLGETFIQDNQSYSEKGVLRGLHFQTGIHAQGKLVRAMKGKVLDIALDLRPESSTYGEWDSIILDSGKNNMFYVPPGFAHGFHALEDSIFFYKCTKYYNKESEGGVNWSDKDLNIDWMLSGEPKVSEKDKQLMSFKDLSAKNITFAK